METMTKKALVKMMMNGVAKKLPAEKSQMIIDESLEGDCSIQEDNVIMSLMNDDMRQGLNDFCELTGISQDDPALEYIMQEIQGPVKLVAKSAEILRQYIDKQFEIIEREVVNVQKQISTMQMSEVQGQINKMEKYKKNGDIYDRNIQRELDSKFEDAIVRLEGDMKLVVDECIVCFPEDMNIKNALYYMTHIRKANTRTMDSKIEILKKELEIYCGGVSKMLELAQLYSCDFNGAQDFIERKKSFLKSVFKVGGKNRIYTYTEEEYWKKKPEYLYKVLCSVEQVISNPSVKLLEQKQ